MSPLPMLLRPGFVLAALSIGAAAVRAQGSLASGVRELRLDTGLVSPSATLGATGGFLVDVPGAPWLRLAFADATLDAHAELRVLSLADGAVQTLSPRELREWRSTSAYFNGDRVWVEVLVPAGGAPSRVQLSNVTYGLPPPPPPPTLCGPDDRQPSIDRRIARLMPSLCTGWLVADCNKGFLTAGHCTAQTDVAQFHVPLSDASGNVVQPPPEHQYIVDLASKQSQNQGVGLDWGYFGCFANADTGLTPFEAQGSAFVLALPPSFDPAAQIRITGHGSDFTPPQHNHVQQTDLGAWVGAVGNTLSYTVDTTGGNSGSPVILVSNNTAIGVHTHAGCNPPIAGNSGTALSNPALQAALAAPQGVLACNGGWSVLCSAQTNSLGCTPAISATGNPSASGGAGSFVIGANNVLNNQTGVLFYGETPASVPFQGGLRCVAGVLVRTATQNTAGNPPPADCSGVLTFDMGARIASGVDPRLVAGASLVAQFWSRDPASAFGSNLTNALRFTLGP